MSSVVGRFAVGLLLATSLVPTGVTQPQSPADDCARADRLWQDCATVNGSIYGENAVLDGFEGSSGADSATPPRTPSGWSNPAPAPIPEREDPAAFAQRTDEFGFLFNIQIDRPCTDPTIATCAEVEPVTLEDIASFHPDTGTTQMEPNGWTIAGLPTNFWIDTTPHTVTGTLLERPATVQFTPVAARFDYGDSTPPVRTPLGRSWDATGTAEFTPTSTSHIYRATGTFTVTPRVEFTVQYSYTGSDYVPIEGILTATGSTLTATIVRASTVLVSGDCTARPTGAGC